MSKELVISAASPERRVAILEEGQLVEIYIEREKEFALVGSIYKGRVTRVLPGMQSAFVDYRFGWRRLPIASATYSKILKITITVMDTATRTAMSQLRLQRRWSLKLCRARRFRTARNRTRVTTTLTTKNTVKRITTMCTPAKSIMSTSAKTHMAMSRLRTKNVTAAAKHCRVKCAAATPSHTVSSKSGSRNQTLRLRRTLDTSTIRRRSIRRVAAIADRATIAAVQTLDAAAAAVKVIAAATIAVAIADADASDVAVDAVAADAQVKPAARRVAPDQDAIFRLRNTLRLKAISAATNRAVDMKIAAIRQAAALTIAVAIEARSNAAASTIAAPKARRAHPVRQLLRAVTVKTISFSPASPSRNIAIVPRPRPPLRLSSPNCTTSRKHISTNRNRATSRRNPRHCLQVPVFLAALRADCLGGSWPNPARMPKSPIPKPKAPSRLPRIPLPLAKSSTNRSITPKSAMKQLRKPH